MADNLINAFTKGTYNLADAENIPKDAAKASSNWITQDGRIKLTNGSDIVGAEGAVGGVKGIHFGYKVDGTQIEYRKVNTVVQYLSGSTWTDIITGLTNEAEYTFSNYSSLAGAFTYLSGIDGIWKIINANPTSPINVTSTTKNFKGYSMIDKGRMLLWNRIEDKTGLYGSWIDRQNATVYTAVASEVTAGVSGTLAFKAGGATRSCFGVTITITTGGQVYSDKYLGILTGSSGGTGTINYATGAWTVSAGGDGTASYTWEDSNVKGVTDFSLSGTRVAGEGFQFPQDIGGDAILNVFIGSDNAYYSLKGNSAYRLYIGALDTAADTQNNVFRRDLGMPNFRAGVSTGKGIIFMNTANPTKPELSILKRNEIGTEVEPYPLFPQFDFARYDYSDCAVSTYDRYVVIACKLNGSAVNDVILLGDTTLGTIDVTTFSARCFASTGDDLHIGSSVSDSVYIIYNGFDDNGLPIENNWDSKDEQYEALGIAEALKKFRRLRIKGLIDPDQSLEVCVSYDGSDFEVVGNILGSGSYVDFSNAQSVGTNIVGTVQIGGEALALAYPFYTELKIKTPKFRIRTFRLKAKGFGYLAVEQLMDRDILIFEKRIPKKYRSKQNVSLDGTQTDQ